jgi:hypothetical protein
VDDNVGSLYAASDLGNCIVFPFKFFMGQGGNDSHNTFNAIFCDSI